MDTRIQTGLHELYSKKNDPLLATLGGLLAPHITNIVAAFLERMQQDAANQPFLGHREVRQTLRIALGDWLQELFRPHAPDEVDALLHTLKRIGERHAQLNVPLISIQLARSLLKEELFRLIMAASRDEGERLESILLADKLLDLAIANINQAFIGGVVEDARHAQSLKLQAVGLDMALQSESLRAALFDWHRRVLVMLFLNVHEACAIPSIHTTDFGLWVHHKGDLLFPASQEIERLKGFIEEIDTQVGLLMSLRAQSNNGLINAAMLQLEELISSATGVLLTIKEQTLAMEAGRDALTKLFNRRFLRTILQREAATSIRTGQRFAAILVDVDHFKRVNDVHGHTAGDLVLSQMAEILMTTVRAGDFVFRYGGEEFLIILNNITEEQAIGVAEKVRKRVEYHGFAIDKEAVLRLTVSLGIALHDNHPDYNRTLIQADDALYQAKEGGRNGWRLAKPA